MQHGRHDELTCLINHLYSAALDAQLWPAIARDVADFMAAPSAALVVCDGGSVRWLSNTDNFGAGAICDYAAYYHSRDVWALRAATIAYDEVFDSAERIADAELLETEFYHDWARGCDVFTVLGSRLALSERQTALFGVHWGHHARRPQSDLKTAFALLVPHVKRAVQIGRHLSSLTAERGAAFEALERTGLATFVVRKNGMILYANADGEALLRAGEGIQAVAGRLLVNGQAAARIETLIASAAAAMPGGAESAGGTAAIARGERFPLAVTVAPFRQGCAGIVELEPAAILFIRDPEKPSLARTALEALYGLTTSEAALANALSDGRSLEEIARSSRISMNTARTHLKAVLGKTGTSRQGQLIALLMRTAVLM